MAANAIDNSNLKDNSAFGEDLSGFVPEIEYAYDAEAKTVTVTHTSTFPAGDEVKSVHVRVHDKFGKEVGESPMAHGSADADGVVDVSSLDASRGLIISATITSTLKLAATGTAHDIGAAGAVGAWAKRRNA